MGKSIFIPLLIRVLSVSKDWQSRWKQGGFPPTLKAIRMKLSVSKRDFAFSALFRLFNRLSLLIPGEIR